MKIAGTVTTYIPLEKSLRRPELLTLPNVPKPMHGVSPRVIFGSSWWDEERENSYKSTNYCCLACGVPKEEAKFYRWLEAHEIYDTDYLKGTLTYRGTAPLCHSCHNFIHSGKLMTDYMTKVIPITKVRTILHHGFSILLENNLNCFYGALELAAMVNLPTNVRPYKNPKKIASWSTWRMVINGISYPPKFENENAWLAHYYK